MSQWEESWSGSEGAKFHERGPVLGQVYRSGGSHWIAMYGSRIISVLDTKDKAKREVEAERSRELQRAAGVPTEIGVDFASSVPERGTAGDGK